MEEIIHNQNINQLTQITKEQILQNHQDNPQNNQSQTQIFQTLPEKQISKTPIQSINKHHLRILPTIQKVYNNRSFLPSIAKSSVNIEQTAIQKITFQQKNRKNAHNIGQNSSFKSSDKIPNFKPSKSLHLTQKKQKTLKDEHYLPAFIRNFELPPKKKIQIVQTMDIFKKREAALKPFLSSPETLKKYKILSHLGKGSFSIVSQAINIQTNKKLAIKTYTKFDQIEQFKFINIGRQIQNMIRLKNHKNVVHLDSVVMDKRKIMLIMENGGQQSLAGILRKRRILPQLQAKHLFRQIVQGISHCHENNICHRDIKLENILVDDLNSIKLIDFGFSSRTQNNLSSLCGTPPYMAPQIVTRKIYEGKGTDIWSIGVILYLMLYGTFPFRSHHEPELFRLIQQGKIQHNQTISSQAKQAINMMVKTNSTERANAGQILNSKWLQT